jgi:hypothetical protein
MSDEKMSGRHRQATHELPRRNSRYGLPDPEQARRLPNPIKIRIFLQFAVAFTFWFP